MRQHWLILALCLLLGWAIIHFLGPPKRETDSYPATRSSR